MASNTPLAPGSVAPPAANYALAVVTDQSQRWLHTSGVVPIRPDGSVPDSLAEQAEVVWSTLSALLNEADMDRTDVVSVTTYVVDGAADDADMGAVMATRDRALAGHLAASTLLVVPRLARPEWKMEISIIAAS